VYAPYRVPYNRPPPSSIRPTVHASFWTTRATLPAAPLRQTGSRLKLAQPEPGTMAWTIPSGRGYATGPTTYPG